MPWSAGTFSRTDGTRNGSTVWNQAKSAAVKINAADHDTHDQDLATGINACLAKDGSNAATADLDLDSHKLTNVTDPTSAQDAATKAYVDGAVGDLSGVTDASAARTALGLGTAAVKDTGTSGATVPLLNASNTWSADQTIQSADAGASTAPTLILDRDSASPAADDQLGGISFNGRDSGGNLVNYGAITGLIIDPTDGSEDGRVDIWTSVGGTLSSRAFVQQGLFMQGASGGDKGAGTGNFAALYVHGNTVVGGGGQYDSGNQTITSAGALTLAHGLGAKPKLVVPILRCATAEAGYSAGDEVVIAHGGGYSTSVDRGISAKIDSTNITIRYGSATGVFLIPHATTGAGTILTNGNWNLIIRAYA